MQDLLTWKVKETFAQLHSHPEGDRSTKLGKIVVRKKFFITKEGSIMASS